MLIGKKNQSIFTMFFINLKQDVCGFLPLSPVPADFVYSAPAHCCHSVQYFSAGLSKKECHLATILEPQKAVDWQK
jgi:hypothetical protein